MEYLVVKFDRSRRVVIDGSPFGSTNTVIQIEAGTHTITLAPPADFSPPTPLTVVIVDTSVITPLTVSFTPAPTAPTPATPAAPKPATPAPAKSATPPPPKPA
jgi:PEGA domain-containing protein